jgi:hypothetical protein
MTRKQNIKPKLTSTEPAPSTEARDAKQPKPVAELDLLSINAGKWYDWGKWT